MIQTILQTLLLITNTISIIAFGIDKINSKKRGQRIPESKLLLLSIFGPFGALAAMLLFRHKTRKIKFLLVPIFTILQTIVLIWYFLPTLNILHLSN